MRNVIVTFVPTKFEIVIPHKTISKDSTSIDHHIIRKDIFTRY